MNFNLFGLLLFSCFIGITGCTNLINFSLASSEILSIAEIKNEELLDNSLTVQGTVEKVIPLLDSYLYLLKGNSQLIWVLTNNNPPSKFQFVTINALLKKEKIVIEGEEQSEFYLEEIDRILKEESDQSN